MLILIKAFIGLMPLRRSESYDGQVSHVIAHSENWLRAHMWQEKISLSLLFKVKSWVKQQTLIYTHWFGKDHLIWNWW